MKLDQNIFALTSQISHIKDNIFKSSPKTLLKIKDVFKNSTEFELMKIQISQEIWDLQHNTPIAYAKDIENLQNQWESTKKELESDHAISNSLKALVLELKEKMKNLYFKRFFSSSTAKDEHYFSDSTSLEDPVIDQTPSVKNSADRSKALLRVTNKLLDLNRYERAIRLNSKIHPSSDKLKSASLILKYLVTHDKKNEVLNFIKSFEDAKEREMLHREMIIGFAKKGQMDIAFQMVSNIKDSESKAYSQSLLTRFLVSKNKFTEAKDLIFEIKDPAYQEDAISYYIKALLRDNRTNEAILFTGSLQDPNLKNSAQKVIESTLLANHQNEKLKRVKDIFAKIYSKTS